MNKPIEKCPLCSNDKLIQIPYPTRNTEGTPFQFTKIANCRTCGYGIAIPPARQEQLDSYYSSGDYWESTVSHNPFQKAHEYHQAYIRLKKCIDYINKLDHLKVLDAGAGHGYIAVWLDNLFDKKVTYYHYIEPDEINKEFIENHDVSFKKRNIKKINSTSEKYNFVLLNHILEHVADPLSFIREIKNQLEPGGIVYIETPNADYRTKEDVFPHTLFFEPGTYEYLAKKLEMRIIDCESFGLFPSRFRAKTLGLLFKFSVFFNTRKIQKIIDSWLWQYNYSGDNGVWIRCILTK